MIKKINATFEINNDFEEHKLRIVLEGMGAHYIKTLPNTDHLKDDKKFKYFLKMKKDAENNLYEFINKNR